MILINSKSIIDCDEKEEELHNKEINNFLDLILKYPNYECALIINRVDIEEKRERIESCRLHEILDNIDYVDLKNGADILIDEGIIHIFCYGQNYIISEVTKMVTNDICVLPYNEDRDFLSLFTNISEIKEFVQNGKI